MARRSATNRDIDALRAIAAPGGSMMAANRAFGRRRGFAEYWATREGISFASHRGSQPVWLTGTENRHKEGCC
jgi:hypothetical protein